MGAVLVLVGATIVAIGIIWRLNVMQERVAAEAEVNPVPAAPARKRMVTAAKTAAAAPPVRAPEAGSDLGPGQALRRSDRILMKVPVEISGTDQSGHPFTERTHTRTINRNGAGLVLMHSPAPEARLTIKNLQTGQSCGFRVCGSGVELADGQREWGADCIEPAPYFWGINFPEQADSTQEQNAVGSLVECTGCHCREMVKLSLPEYRTVVREGFAPRRCTWCGSDTLWKFATVQPAEGHAARGASAPQPSPAAGATGDRRGEERHIIQLAISVRQAGGREELTTAEDMGTSGLCCALGLELAAGEQVFVRLASEKGLGDAELRADVLWRRPGIGGHRSYYGMKLHRG